MEPKGHIQFKNGMVIINGSLSNGENVLVESENKVHLIAILEEVAKATPNEIDDKALPFLKMIANLIESKQLAINEPASDAPIA